MSARRGGKKLRQGKFFAGHITASMSVSLPPPAPVASDSTFAESAPSSLSGGLGAPISASEVHAAIATCDPGSMSSVRAVAKRVEELCTASEGVLECILQIVCDSDMPKAAAAGACLVALARHHWGRLPASMTGPARDQMLEIAIHAHVRVRTPEGRSLILDALKNVAISNDGELQWPGVVDRLRAAFDASVKGWTSDKPIPNALVDSVKASYAVVRRYEFPNAEETIWEESPEILDDMIEKLVHPMVKRVLIAVLRDRGKGGARVPKSAWASERRAEAAAPKVQPVQPGPVQEGKIASQSSEFTYVPPHLRNKASLSPSNKENAMTHEFHGMFPVDLARIVAKIFFRATRSFTPEGMDDVVSDLFKVYPMSFMKELLPNSLRSHGGSLSPQAWRLHSRMLKLLLSVQKNEESLEIISRYHARMLDLLCRSVRGGKVVGNKRQGKGSKHTLVQKNTLIPDQVLGLCFDNIGIICDSSRQVWLTDMQPQLESFIRFAIFPVLALGPADQQLWAKNPNL